MMILYVCHEKAVTKLLDSKTRRRENIMTKEQTEKLYKNIGEFIAELRRIRKLTRKEVAGKAGISEKFLYEIESGKKGFTVASLYSISGALQVDVEDVLTCNRAVYTEYNKEE